MVGHVIIPLLCLNKQILQSVKSFTAINLCLQQTSSKVSRNLQ